MTDEQRFTLAEAQAELARQECEAGGHRPVVFTFGGPAGCRCGAVVWVPKMTGEQKP